MQSFIAGQTNTMYADMVSRVDGKPIATGTVTGYLKALLGANANRYYQVSDGSWQIDASSAGAMTNDRKARWTLSIPAGAWIAGVRYVFSAEESGDLHIAYSDEVTERVTEQETNITVETTVIDTVGTTVV